MRASMKLDNRSKKLLVKEVESDSLQAVRDWYEAGGQVDAFETLENGDVVVTFRTRAAAEQVRLLNVVAVRSVDLKIFAGSRQRTQHPASWPKTNKLVQCFTDGCGSDDWLNGGNAKQGGDDDDVWCTFVRIQRRDIWPRTKFWRAFAAG